LAFYFQNWFISKKPNSGHKDAKKNRLESTVDYVIGVILRQGSSFNRISNPLGTRARYFKMQFLINFLKQQSLDLFVEDNRLQSN